MQSFDLELQVHRGESFSIDFVLENPNGSPYVLTNKAINPYFLLTISSSKYSQEGRYIKNWWLEIPKYLLFYNTNPVELPEAIITTNMSPYSFDNINVGNYTGDASGYAVYYYKDIAGKKHYKRWTGTEYVDYELRIIKTFSKSDTEEWVAQNYVYSINYVDGDKMYDYLLSLYNKENLSVEGADSNEELYLALSNVKKEYKNIQWDRELSKISISLPIVVPTKLIVLSEINGGIII